MKYLWFIPLFILLWIVFDVVRALSRKKFPKKPNYQVFETEVLARLGRGEEIPDEEILEKLQPTFDFIKNRYDCSDFRMISLLRIYIQFGDKLPQQAREKIKETVISFRYWMDQPGKDSMCFWSENHQILFAASEYLAGQTFPDETFTNDGKSGKEHMAIAAKRIEYWADFRFKYGFSEWYSNVYYVEDLAPLSNLAEFAKDEAIKLKATMILDIFWFDVATHSHKGAFVSTGGRMYSNNKISSDRGNSLRDPITHLWPEFPVGKPETGGSMTSNFILNKTYKLPAAIRNIMLDESEQIIRASNGLSVWEMKNEGLIGQSTKQIMMQFGKEAFTAPPLLANTIRYLSKNKMFNNSFLNLMGFLNIGFFRLFHLLCPLSKLIKSPSDHSALNRANVYAYRTKDYIMATAQQYGTGTVAYQQHIFSATLDRSLSLFTTWPGKMEDKGVFPQFILGSFRLPHAFQHENIAIMIYDLTIKKHIAEKKPLNFTHAFFPTELMDEHIIEGSYAFCRKGDSFAAVIGVSKLELGPMRDESIGNFDLKQPYSLRQYGKVQCWVIELSSQTEEGTFERFVERIKSNTVKFEQKEKSVTYTSRGDEIAVAYKKKVMVNASEINTEYKRFDSAYSVTERKAEEIIIHCEGAKLTLNKNKLIHQEEFIQ